MLAVERFRALPAELSLKIVPLAAASSIGTRPFFGDSPARKAPLPDPVEASHQQ